jgi:hypothetical protein
VVTLLTWDIGGGLVGLIGTPDFGRDFSSPFPLPNILENIDFFGAPVSAVPERKPKKINWH